MITSVSRNIYKLLILLACGSSHIPTLKLDEPYKITTTTDTPTLRNTSTAPIRRSMWTIPNLKTT